MQHRSFWYLMVTKYIGDKLEISGTDSRFFHQHLKKVINMNFAFYFMPGSVAKVGCVFSIAVVSKLLTPHAEFWANDHREDASHFLLLSHTNNSPFVPWVRMHMRYIPMLLKIHPSIYSLSKVSYLRSMIKNPRTKTAIRENFSSQRPSHGRFRTTDHGHLY